MKINTIFNLSLFFLMTTCCAEEVQFYSQVGQDKFVYENYFKDKKQGVFVDIGAFDGVTGSNSYFFEKMGWTGICVEPIPSRFNDLVKIRSCHCVNACVGEKGESLFLHIDGPDEMLSGLVDKYDPRHRNLIDRIGPQVNDKHHFISVNCIPFMDLIDKYGIKHIDYLSIDTEGGELDILKSIDFDKVTIDVIDVENNYRISGFLDFLRSKGYELVKTLEIDEIFVKTKK